jgi:ABC-type phosphate transport system substrate-binding protein
MKNRAAKYILFVPALLLAFAVASGAAEIAVIVNKDNGNAIDRALVEKIYKGELTNWPDGGRIEPLDLPENSDVRASFTSSLYGKSVTSLKAIWAVKLYSGRGTPPREMSSDNEVKNAVSSGKNAIGYIKAADVDGSVKVIMTLR